MATLRNARGTYLIDRKQYADLYHQSITHNEEFWAQQGRRIDWIKPYTAEQVKRVSYARDDLHIRWYADGTLNVCANCIDRHLATKSEHTAIIWEGDEPGQHIHISYRQLHREVCQFANALQSLGVQKGDCVTIYMPMIPEAAYAMLACARIGAIHSVVFGGFSPTALSERISDCQSRWLVTADEGVRGGKTIPLKENVDHALSSLPLVEKVLVVPHNDAQINWVEGRDINYSTLKPSLATDCPAVEMNAEDPLFILYTSGSTGKPKGVLHTCGGYLVYAALTHQYVFDYQEGDIYWCTADVGWITGHSYLIYGPLANGATTLMFASVPTYPDARRIWQVCDTHQVTICYTAPTLIRTLMREGDAPVQATSRSSLRLLGTVGEPINPQAWEWYYQVVGNATCPIVDTWWQTETGGILITPLPGATDLKPGSATRPFFGIQPAIVNDRGAVLSGTASGNLVITDSWPGQMRTIYGNHQRFIDTYFSTFDGMYFTGDGARRDEDGYYWLTGRIDDVINVAGHRIGTAEIESALVAHPSVAESAVVGYPHHTKGEGIYCYVTPVIDVIPDDDLRSALIQQVRDTIGAFATPDYIQWATSLPKTRSGKIMRRILRHIASNNYTDLGDTSTLANKESIDTLIAERLNSHL